MIIAGKCKPSHEKNVSLHNMTRLFQNVRLAKHQVAPSKSTDKTNPGIMFQMT